MSKITEIQSPHEFNSDTCAKNADTSASERDSSKEPARNDAYIGLSVEPSARRGPGAPKGNKNRLEHGAYSRDLEIARKRRLKGKARRLVAETLSAVLNDQGPLDSLSL